MNELKLRLITAGSLDSLEKVLHSSTEDGLRVKNFSAEHIPERGQYQVQMCLSGMFTQDQVVMKLAKEEDIRELIPLRR